MTLAAPKSLAGDNGGALFGGSTQPTLSVSGRTDGEAYTVSAGARSLTITAQSGATLLTTVEKASDGSSVSVTDATTDTPDWTSPGGGSTGEAVQVQVTATLDGYTSQVSFTERVAGSGGGSGGAWTSLLDLDLTDVTTASAITSGTSTLTFVSSADTIDVTVSRYSSGNGSMTPTNGTGLVFSTNGPGTLTAALDFTAQLAAWDRSNVSSYIYAVHMVVESLAYSAAGDSLQCGVGINTTHNTGDSRLFFSACDTVTTDEDRRTRNNTSNGAIIDTVTIIPNRVITAIIIGGAIVEVMDTVGTTPPTPAPGGASTYTVGADAVGQQDTTPQYLSCYSILNAGFGASFTVTRMLVQRFQ